MELIADCRLLGAWVQLLVHWLTVLTPFGLEQSPSDMANGMGWTAESHDTLADTTAVQSRKDAKGKMMENIKSTLLAEQKVCRNMPLHAHSLDSSLNSSVLMMVVLSQTMRALRSKMHQTKNLQANLENTLDATEHELAKMQVLSLLSLISYSPSRR